ncbi:uncharacterized protein EI90DRAFT_3040572 [Cantharellus anzutake]|uniref:uncharacterized protein n=1 Tax=Cantharellus anzutake TaxID=1750568 RepID=UPI00190334A9|nr:uncharacterized protein EI90DRAFT_3040572 [Cantharellus anzutake]KAF8339133.1 hypothetical protein EI90DRAFT_3040572 [Cantharellus anzutake]
MAPQDRNPIPLLLQRLFFHILVTLHLSNGRLFETRYLGHSGEAPVPVPVPVPVLAPIPIVSANQVHSIPNVIC